MAQISVIIPCYNQEKYISEAIESVLAQTFEDYEIIVVNDGSSDNSISIIKDYAKKYSNKIRYIDQANQGVISARNNAIKMANGVYIFPLDGDDKIAPNCLDNLYEAMINNKGDVIYSEGEYFGDASGRFELLPATKYNMCIQNRVCVSALYRKEDWFQYNGYDEIMKKGLEDWDFWLNFVEEDKVFYKIEEPLFFYRILKSSRNHAITPKLNAELIRIMMKKHKKLFNWKFKLKKFFLKILHCLYQKKIKASGKVYIKICKVSIPLKLIQQIFSVTNQYKKGYKFKCIKLFGIKFMIKKAKI